MNYCFKCSVTVSTIPTDNICPECKRKTKYVDFYPTLRNSLDNGYAHKICYLTPVINGNPLWYRYDLLYVTEEGKKIYGYI